MKKILILITTYKRPQKLLDLLKDIYANSKGFQVELIVYEDYSDSNYGLCKRYLRKYLPDFTWRKAKEHYGKEQYWEWISYLYMEAKEKEFDYLIQWPDDQRLTPNAIHNAIEIYEAIDDPDKICCTLMQHVKKRTRCWTPINSELIRVGNTNVYKTGWVDLNFIAERKFLEELEYHVKPIDRNLYSFSSSGVGMYISWTLHEKGYAFYQVEKSLTIHTAGLYGSMMHTEERKINPGLTNHNKVTASMATMPERMRSLEITVLNIIDQVDELHIYLNNFTKVPDFLKHDKIKTYLSKDHLGDLGDVGKFYKAESIRGYHFTIDDDIIYPPDYVSHIILEIERHRREYIIGAHGRIFNSLPIKSYYHGHTRAFPVLGAVKENTFVHVTGTGAMAYHTDTIQVPLSIFITMNMADIWFSKYCNDQSVPILVIKHNKGWVKDTANYDKNYAIYNFCHRNDAYQTEIINDTRWNDLTVL